MKDKKQVRTFGWGLTIFFIVIGTLKIVFSGEIALHWHFIAAGITAAANLVFPLALLPVYKLAIFIAKGLGWFNTRLLLGLLYFIVFTLFALVLKVLGKDLLDRKLDRQAETYWNYRDRGKFDPANVENQF